MRGSPQVKTVIFQTYLLVTLFLLFLFSPSPIPQFPSLPTARKNISLGRRQDEGLVRREASTGRSDLRFGGGVVESRNEKKTSKREFV